MPAREHKSHQKSNSSLLRFIDAQDNNASGYKAALTEMKQGSKKSHWIWYIFPQLLGLGRSEDSVKYAIENLDEACAYLRNDTLFQRYNELVAVVRHQLETTSVFRLMGSSIDEDKLVSSLTLFRAAAADLSKSSAEENHKWLVLYENCHYILTQQLKKSCATTLRLIAEEAVKKTPKAQTKSDQQMDLNTGSKSNRRLVPHNPLPDSSDSKNPNNGLLLSAEKHLKIIQKEVELLEKNHHAAAAKDGQLLVQALQTELDAYNRSAKKSSDCDRFKQNCQRALETAKKSPNLHRHYGLMWAINLLLHLMTLGTVYVVNKWIRHQINPMAFFNTKIVNTANSLSQSIQKDPQSQF